MKKTGRNYQPFECKYCKEILPNKFKLANHVKLHHPRRKKRVVRNSRGKLTQTSPQLDVNFCPCCGFRIGVLATAVRVAGNL